MMKEWRAAGLGASIRTRTEVISESDESIPSPTAVGHDVVFDMYEYQYMIARCVCVCVCVCVVIRVGLKPTGSIAPNWASRPIHKP